MGRFNWTEGFRVAGKDAVDGDRYIAATTSQRDALITNGRAGEGQQVYVLADHTLYILKGATVNDWEVLAQGVAPSGDLSFIHTQSSPLITWSITHNLGKYPAVVILDSNNDVVESQVHHTDNNSVVLSFNVAVSGIAIFN